MHRTCCLIILAATQVHKRSLLSHFFCNLSFFPRIIHKLVLAKVSMPGAKYSGTVVGLRALGERGHQWRRQQAGSKSQYKWQGGKTKESGKSKRHQTQAHQQAEGVFAGQASAAAFSASISICREKRKKDADKAVYAWVALSALIDSSASICLSLAPFAIVLLLTDKKNPHAIIALYKYQENHLYRELKGF